MSDSQGAASMDTLQYKGCDIEYWKFVFARINGTVLLITPGFFSGFRNIIRTEGPLALYQGVGIGKPFHKEPNFW